MAKGKLLILGGLGCLLVGGLSVCLVSVFIFGWWGWSSTPTVAPPVTIPTTVPPTTPGAGSSNSGNGSTGVTNPPGNTATLTEPEMPPDPPLNLPKNPLDEELPAPRAAALARACLAKLPAAKGEEKESLLALALEYAGQAVEEAPQEAIYHLLMTEVCLSAPKNTMLTTLAEHHMTEAVKLKPQDVDVRLMYAKVKALAEMYDKALEHFEYVTLTNPDRLTADNVATMAQCYVLDQQTERGLNFFVQCLTRKPNAHAVRMAYAIMLYRGGQREPALVQVRLLRQTASVPAEFKQYATTLEMRWLKGE